MFKAISLGAGVQSSTMLLMSLRGDIERAGCAIFADTGWEPQAVYDHLERLKVECRRYHFPLHVVSRGNIRNDLLVYAANYAVGRKKWQRGNMPFAVIDRSTIQGLRPDVGGRLSRQCTTEYKIKPIHRKVRELLGYKKGQQVNDLVELWLGISIDEAHRMKDSRERWIYKRYPLVEAGMDRHNCRKWLERYGWWAPKSSCVGCPYHSNRYWREMKVHRPWEWQDAVEFDCKLRERPYPGVTGAVYLHRDMVPLDQVDLETDRDRGQMDMFGEECEGMCGV